MVRKKLQQERRADPRFTGSVPVKISQEDGDIVTETVNISRSGANCRVNKFIETMTKLRINLLLPIKKNNKIDTKKISCEGVVVRVKPVPEEDAYNVAIFFNDISARDAEYIADYVNAYLEQEQQS